MSVLSSLKKSQAATIDTGEDGDQASLSTNAVSIPSRIQALRVSAPKTSLGALAREMTHERGRETRVKPAFSSPQKMSEASPIRLDSEYDKQPDTLDITPSESEKTELLALIYETASVYGCPKEEIQEIKEAAFKSENVFAALTCFRSMKKIRTGLSGAKS